MATTQDLAIPMADFGKSPIVRQVGLMVGVAASVAIGVAVALWSQKPNYSLLYGSLSGADVSEVMAALEQANIPYRVDESNGALSVPGGKVHEARMKLATQGLPNSTSVGFDLLEKDAGFGTSRFMENARFQRALEGELARSISQLTNVQAARVHLAIPRQSTFVRNRRKPTASVVIDLYAGRNLEQGVVQSIVHLVAASVPELEAGQVTVVDDRGRMLSSAPGSGDMMLTARQFEYARKLEEIYVRRIENILAPMMGAEGVRAQVNADVDFTVTEETQESFDQTQPALRSEQVQEETSRGPLVAQGIPGALSNQPPGAGSAPETLADVGPDAEPAVGPPINSNRQSTRNYELDKTISHVRSAPGKIRRLSVAVLVDGKATRDESGKTEVTPRSEAEMARITELVKEAIGFEETRGDTVNVINENFLVPEAPAPLPEPPFWQQPWLWDALKQAAGGAVVLFLIFGVLKPTMRSLATAPRVVRGTVQGIATDADGNALPNQEQAQLAANGEPVAQLAAPGTYQERLDLARKVVTEDPKRVAQVMKTWVANDV